MTPYKKIQILLDSDITGYKIAKKSKLSRATVTRLRTGTRKIGNISFDTALKLIEAYDELIEKKK